MCSAQPVLPPIDKRAGRAASGDALWPSPRAALPASPSNAWGAPEQALQSSLEAMCAPGRCSVCCGMEW